jgi:anti-sigma factor RsiW
MQEALDENLTPEARAELYAHLEKDVRDAGAFERLKDIDQTLRAAPHERAPQRLAMNIMARLAEMAESIDPKQLSRISGLALALALSLVAAVLLPLLIAAGWLLLSAFGSAAALTAIIHHIVALLAVGITILEAVVQRAQEFLAANPQVPLLMISLIPISLIWLLRYVPRNRTTNPT